MTIQNVYGFRANSNSSIDYYLIASPKFDFQAAKVCVWSSKINISFLYKAFRSHRQHIVFQFWMQVLVAFTEFNSLVFKLAQSFLPELPNKREINQLELYVTQYYAQSKQTNSRYNFRLLIPAKMTENDAHTTQKSLT